MAKPRKPRKSNKVHKPRKAGESKITRLRAQTKAIRVGSGLALCLFGLTVGSLAVATALPQKRKLSQKERELAQVELQERQILALKDDQKASYEALREDPEYLELHARDRLNVYRRGEKIYRIERDR